MKKTSTRIVGILLLISAILAVLSFTVAKTYIIAIWIALLLLLILAVWILLTNRTRNLP